MTTPAEWANSPTDCMILTCDGKGVAAKRKALEKLIKAAQDELLQVIEDKNREIKELDAENDRLIHEL